MGTQGDTCATITARTHEVQAVVRTAPLSARAPFLDYKLRNPCCGVNSSLLREVRSELGAGMANEKIFYATSGKFLDVSEKLGENSEEYFHLQGYSKIQIVRRKNLCLL